MNEILVVSAAVGGAVPAAAAATVEQRGADAGQVVIPGDVAGMTHSYNEVSS
jgi:hypothetical protein